MVGIAASLRLAVLAGTTLLLQGAASRVEASESSEQVSCAFATTFQIKNLIGMRTSRGNSLVADVQTEINQMAELCEQKESDAKTIAQLTKDIPDLANKIRDTSEQLKKAAQTLADFESLNKDATDSACSAAHGLAGAGAQVRRSIGSLFKKSEHDPEQNAAIERAKDMNKKCSHQHKLRATVERLTKELPNLQEQKHKKEVDLASLKMALPDRTRAIQAAKAKTFAEINAVFSGRVESMHEGRKRSGSKNNHKGRKHRSSK